MPKPVIIIPIHKPQLDPYEQLSVQRCAGVLGKYDLWFIGPESLRHSPVAAAFSGQIGFRAYDDHHFESIASYNHLMLSPWFYDGFSEYDFLLVYQPDAFVFEDRLDYWMEQEYSFLGSPLFERLENGRFSDRFMGYFNGGLSLRKVADMIRVLNSSKKVYTLKECMRVQKRYGNRLFPFWGGIDFLNMYRFNDARNVQGVNEDKILSQAARRFPFFKVPDPEVALTFAFETRPGYSFELVNRELPFGCHAWWTYDINFYRPIFAELGYKI